MNTLKRVSTIVILCLLVLTACSPVSTETQLPAPTATVVPSPTPRPEQNVALNKPVRVSASWVVDPPERAVDGNLNNWWGAGGVPPQWIEVDLEGIYSISRIKVINQGPEGQAAYRVFGRGPDNKNRLLHVFDGVKRGNQTLEFSPETPWEDISTVRIEINGGLGWVGLREIQVFSRDDPKPLPVSTEITTPLFLAQVQPDMLEPITADNAVLMKQLAMFGRGKINDLTWSLDGRLLAAASPLGVWLYNPEMLNSPPRLLEGHTRDVLSVAFSPDGSMMLSGSQDGTVKQWDTATGTLKRTISLWDDFNHEVNDQNRNLEVWSMAFSPDGTLIAAGSLDGTLRLWDLTTGRERTTLKGHTRQINNLAFSPDGSLLASSGSDGSLFIWDVATGDQRATLSSEGQVQGLVFSPDGNTLAYGGIRMSVHLWDTVEGKERAELSEHISILSLAFGPDGKTLASGSLTGTVMIWEEESASSRIFREHADWVMNMAYSPDGETLATYAWDGTLRLWETATGVQTAGVSAHTSPVTSIAFSPDGTVLASGGEDNIVRLWDVGTNQLRAILWKHSARVTGVAFSLDGKLLASSSFDRTVRLWDTATGKQVAVLEGHESYVRCVAISPDGKIVASGGTDQTVRLWDPVSGEARTVLSGHTGEVEGVAFSQDGIWLASASADKTIRIWEVATGKEASVLQGHQSFVNGITFSPDGTMLASAGADHWLRLWDWEVVSSAGTGKERPTPKGQPGWVLSVAFSPDGEIVASANLSTPSYWITPGEIHLYSSASGYPYVMLRGHTKRVTSIAFSPDGKLFASGSADGSVRLWGTQSEGFESGSQPVTTAPTLTPASSSLASSTRDEFNGSLAEGWRWTNENTGKWSLTENPGFLRIYASPYEVDGKTSNQLLSSVPQGDFVVITHLIFEPITNFQFAGLFIYQDDGNSLSFGRAFCDTSNVCVGNGIYFDNVVGGTWAGNNYATPVDNQNEAYLRLERRGETVKAFYSDDGAAWLEIGTHLILSDFQVNGVGLIASGDYNKSDADIPADFDFFEISEIREDAQTSTPKPVDKDPFVGDWGSTDPGDKSKMTLTIARNGDDYDLTLFDEKAGVCGKDSAGKPKFAIEMTFTGIIHGETLNTVSTSAMCLSSPEAPLPGEFLINFTYDPATDTLWDSSHQTIWKRN